MKKVAIICAAGKEGALLVDEAVSRGYDVTGFVRKGKKVANPKAKTVEKDLFELTREDLAGFDAVIDAFGAWTPETLPLHRTSLARLCDIRKRHKGASARCGRRGKPVRQPRAHRSGQDFLQSFPEAFRPLANMQGAALDDLRKRSDVQWTFLSPGAGLSRLLGLVNLSNT